MTDTETWEARVPPAPTARRALDQRFILLAIDGSWTTISRQDQLNLADFTAADRAAWDAKTSGWIALMTGNPHGRKLPALNSIACVGPRAGTTFRAAVLRFAARHAGC